MGEMSSTSSSLDLFFLGLLLFLAREVTLLLSSGDAPRAGRLLHSPPISLSERGRETSPNYKLCTFQNYSKFLFVYLKKQTNQINCSDHALKMDDQQCSPGQLLSDHLYYKDTYLFSCDSVVLLVKEQEEGGKYVIVLDRTVMHPQGGIYMHSL